jgi:hypothetical protein
MFRGDVIFSGMLTNFLSRDRSHWNRAASDGKLEAGMKEALVHPKHPERICWGCKRYCPANDLACREERLAHPIEFYGYDWLSFEDASTEADPAPENNAPIYSERVQR